MTRVTYRLVILNIKRSEYLVKNKNFTIMHFFNTIIQILHKPFPEEESRFGSLKVITILSLFVVFFLYIFQPFGISTLPSNKFWICLGFGVMTFLATIVYEFIVGQLFQLKGKGENWTFGKWIINNLGAMLCISLANFLFARLFIFGYIQWDLFPHMIYGTFMIGIIPIVVLGGFSLMKQEKKFQHLAAEINQREVPPVIKPSVEKTVLFDIPIQQIRFVEALQNYVKIGYINTEGLLIKQTQRATLKQITKETTGSAIVKSHRSFLVNRDAIISTSGNAQGLLLTLSDCDVMIPVSRSYVKFFR